MKKFLLSIFALMLAVFSVQAEEVKYQISSTTAVTTNGTVPSGSTATFKNTYTSNKEQLTKNNSMTLTLKGYTGCKITGITLYMKSNKSAGSGSFTMKAGATELSAITASAFNNKNWNGAYTTTYTDVVPAMKNADYIIGDGEDVIITIAATANSLYCQSFTITYEEVGGGETPDVPVLQAPDAPTLPTPCNFDNSMTIEITNIAEGATAYYLLNNDTDWTEGTSVTISETTTVYAKVVKDELSSNVVSATYTKNKPLPDGWIDDVLNRELTGVSGTTYSSWSGKTATSLAVYAGQSAGSNDAIQLRSDTDKGFSGIVTTKSGGKAKKIVVEWNSNTSDGRTLDVYGKNTAYSAATDLYSDSTQGTKIGSIKNGTSTEVEITGDYEYIGLRSASGAMYLTSVSITWDASNVVVVPDAPMLPESGDFVTLKNIEIANFNNYENGTTVYYSIDGGDFIEYTTTFPITTSCEIVAYAEKDGKKSAEVRAEYTRIAKDPEINILGDANADAFEGSIEVEIRTENGATAYYTLNGEDPNIGSTEYEGILTIKATATLKVIAIEAGEYESGVTTKDFVMAVTGSDNIEGESCTLSFANKAQRTEFSTSKQVWEQNGITLTNNKGSGNNLADYAAPVRFYKNSEIIVEFTSPIAKIEFACNTSEYATNLKNSISGSTVSGKTVTVQLDGSSNSFTIENLSGGQVRMDALTVTPVAEASASSFNLTIGNAGWATLFLDYAVEIPEGVTCYTVAEVNSEKVTLASVTGVLPAKTGVIVKANAGLYEFKPTDNVAEVAEVAELSGTTGNKYIFEEAYVLGIVDGEVGLYKAEMAGGVWLNNANKAYLPASEVSAGAALSASLRFDFGGTTAIEEVETEAAETVIYDLTGRRVNEITKAGVYIINGHKVLVK